jgi:hypothetical protein
MEYNIIEQGRNTLKLNPGKFILNHTSGISDQISFHSSFRQ